MSDINVTITLDVDADELVGFSLSQSTGRAYLTLGDVAEVALDRVHLQAIQDELPGALACLDKMLLDDAVREMASNAAKRTANLAAYVQDQADAAEADGETERAAELRAAADTLITATDDIADGMLTVMGTAVAADQAAVAARQLLDRRVRSEPRPDVT